MIRIDQEFNDSFYDSCSCFWNSTNYFFNFIVVFCKKPLSLIDFYSFRFDRHNACNKTDVCNYVFTNSFWAIFWVSCGCVHHQFKMVKSPEINRENLIKLCRHCRRQLSAVVFVPIWFLDEHLHMYTSAKNRINIVFYAKYDRLFHGGEKYISN